VTAITALNVQRVDAKGVSVTNVRGVGSADTLTIAKTKRILMFDILVSENATNCVGDQEGGSIFQYS